MQGTMKRLRKALDLILLSTTVAPPTYPPCGTNIRFQNCLWCGINVIFQFYIFFFFLRLKITLKPKTSMMLSNVLMPSTYLERI